MVADASRLGVTKKMKVEIMRAIIIGWCLLLGMCLISQIRVQVQNSRLPLAVVGAEAQSHFMAATTRPGKLWRQGQRALIGMRLLSGCALLAYGLILTFSTDYLDYLWLNALCIAALLGITVMALLAISAFDTLRDLQQQSGLVFLAEQTITGTKIWAIFVWVLLGYATFGIGIWYSLNYFAF